MRGGGLRVLVAVVVAAVIVLALWSWSPSSKPVAIEPLPAPDSTSPTASELTPVPPTRETAKAVDPAPEPDIPTLSLVEEGARTQQQYEFDVTFVPLDDLGRVLAGVRVEFALVGHRANCMGYTNEEGELRRRWRSDLLAIHGTVWATSELGSTCTNDVVLTAGAPETVRFGAQHYAKTLNAFSSKAAVERPVGEPDARLRDMLFFAPPFEVDYAGNGVFTDPDLIVIDDPTVTSYKTQSLKARTSRKVDSQPSPRAGLARIEVTVHGALPYLAPWRTFGGVGNEGRDAHTDRYGRFICYRQVLGPVELEVGGGVFTKQRKKFDLVQDGSTQSWDVEIHELPTVRGLLRDADGKPLVSWRVQAREDLPPFGFLQAYTITNAAGFFKIGLSGNDTVRLLVSPPDDIEQPAVLLAEHQAASEQASEFVLPNAQIAKGITWEVSAPGRAVGAFPEARIVQRDSFDGVTLTPCNAAWSAGAWTWSYRLERAVVGTYQITCEIPGARSISEVQVAVGASSFGPRPYPNFFRIAVPELVTNAHDQLTIRALETADGVRVRSEVLPFPGSYFVPEGDVQLWIVGTTSEGRPVKLKRDVSGRSGDRVVLLLDELHRAPTGPVSGAMPR